MIRLSPDTINPAQRLAAAQHRSVEDAVLITIEAKAAVRGSNRSRALVTCRPTASRSAARKRTNRGGGRLMPVLVRDPRRAPCASWKPSLRAQRKQPSGFEMSHCGSGSAPGLLRLWLAMTPMSPWSDRRESTARAVLPNSRGMEPTC